MNQVDYRIAVYYKLFFAMMFAHWMLKTRIS